MSGAASLKSATSEELIAAFAVAARLQGRKRVHCADGIMAEIVAKRLAEHLRRAGFVVMKKPAEIRGATFGGGFEG